ncbi:glycosyl hydrolase family 67 [Sediminihabitans luteus]|uniref:Glycosyl hydrolase family 67 n=1 Tax=Sediminihabitans luteus TaxID=1138585 RepID=A0A2M9D159_9CELL|nr:hypothetical protein [Sediminihabitans luteus]PJJ77813.1 glycosyl hydrolase family 67 [Sediminihabitans luteus]GII99829.1 hypothetical protein Slu03_22070 [Sediminihabitans luteus]
MPTTATPPSPTPATARRRALRAPLLALTALVLLLALGFGLAGQIGGFLAISTTPVEPVPDTSAVAPVRADDPAPAITTVAVPDDVAVVQAAGELADAVASRGAPLPTVVTGPGSGAPGELAVSTGATLPAPAGGGADDEAYRASSDTAGWSLEAADARGAAAGLYRLADRVRTGHALLPADEDGVVVAPALATRLVDKGAAGVDDSPEAWGAGDPYSHNSGAFDDAILDDAPYVDADAFAGDAAELRDYVDRTLARGYDAIVLPGFLEYVTFSGVGDGHEVYAEDDPHVGRALAMREAWAPLWRYAHERGMRVYLSTDMLALSTPLEEYLDARGWDAQDARTWDVYAAGLRELFEETGVDGLMIRIGEGGAIYDNPGWDYWSELGVTTPDAVRRMLTAFLAVAEDADRDVIFRSWSVGVGAVGDMHTNPESYAAVLDGIDSPHLVVSTKLVAGDFYSWLPLNPTLDVGTQRRVVEFQARREFEAFGAVPNDLGSQLATALDHYRTANPQVEGAWTWTQDGGPWHAGPLSLYGRTGFWQLYDLNVYVAGRLAWDPDADPAQLTADWARATFSDDPATVHAVAQAMADSREAVTQGLYVAPFARTSTRALGLEPPPMMWIFEWDILTGDSAALDSIYSVVRDSGPGAVDDAIAQGAAAVATAEGMRATIAGTDAATWTDPASRRQMLDALDYEVDLLRMLSAYRTLVLRHAQWLDTGSATVLAQRDAAREAWDVARADHLDRYGDDVALPAYTVTAADLGTARADRDPAAARWARTLLVVLVVALALGTAPAQRLLVRRGRRLPGAGAARALWVGATRPWRLADEGAGLGRADRVLLVAVPVLALVASRVVYTWALAPAHLALVLGAWAVFGLVLLLAGGRRGVRPLVAAVGGAAVARTVVLLVALSPRGPGGYWFGFWTAPGARTAYVTVAFAGFAWVLVCAAFALRVAGFSRAGAVGRVLAAGAAPLVLGGLGVAALGTEHALTVWNDQMALLPWGLSRILGITVHLGIPTDLPLLVAALGATVLAAVAVAWLVLRAVGARRRSA